MSSVKKKKTVSEKIKCLVIVESPAKSKTINKILGKGYKVVASMGHIIDLPVDRMGIDFENGFKPEYTVIKGRKKYLTSLKKDAKNAEAVYLAADPDREGEAICWHIKNQFAKNKAKIYRVSFEEITERAVKKAFEHPGVMDMNKVNAQQARRLLDRIVGYSISPVLWRKITRGLSAGRVQSVAVKLIVERENEIKKFKQQEYWSIEAVLAKKTGGISFKAKLVKYKEKKVHIPDKENADRIISELGDEKFEISAINRKDKKSYPRAPYTTSSLQQDAFNKLNFSASKTMRVAQGLYEGKELGSEGSVGLITYMRTDSVRISDEATKEVRLYINDKFGEKYCPPAPPKYKSKGRAQEAHEAIRPTLTSRSPREVVAHLSTDEYKLYNLIWKKFVSSQMTNALFSVLAVNINAGDYGFHAGGGRLIFDGFLRVYRDDGEFGQEMPDMPSIEKGEELDALELMQQQHFTKPPPRYTDASLVKVLEEKGIGRPSTYAPIIRTVITRNYIKRMARSLCPTELGELVNTLLVENFPDIVDDAFTARMEDALDEVEDGKMEWAALLKDFYGPFQKKLEEAKERIKSVKYQSVKTDEICEKCGKHMVIKWGRRGRFLSCSAFPSCREARSITTGVKCPEEGCEGELIERRSKRGAFYGCTKYPKCTYTSRKLPSETKDGQDANDSVEEE